MTPGPRALGAILERCDVGLGGTALETLWRYHQMLRAANARLNLTRIHNFENMVLKHYVDSLLVLRFVDLPSPLIDMGSGPGLPGVPLKIARPEIEMVLAEPRGARAEFLREVREKLGLENITVYDHKLGLDYPGRVAGVISRAVGPVPETLDRVAACLPPGGRMFFMKGPECSAEIAEANESHAGAFRLVLDQAYAIPESTHQRRLLVYERLEGDAPEGLKASRGRTVVSHAFGGTVREIVSATNPTFKHCRELLHGAGVRKHGEALLAGPRIIEEVIARFPDHAIGWLSGSDGPAPPAEGLEWLRLSGPLFQELDVFGTRAPLLLVKTPTFDDWSDDLEWPEGCTLFVPFQDPENVGAVVRSAAAFGVARVVLTREAAHPFHPRSSRAAGPALFQVPLLRGPRLAELNARSAPLIALDTSGPELSETPFPERFGLVLGVEGPGLPDHLRHGPTRRIAIRPEVESLNAATAAAVALYAWARQEGREE